MTYLQGKTPISFLQELCTKRGITPTYDLIANEGAVHEPTFVFKVTAGDFIGTGKGTTEKVAVLKACAGAKSRESRCWGKKEREKGEKTKKQKQKERKGRNRENFLGRKWVVASGDRWLGETRGRGEDQTGNAGYQAHLSCTALPSCAPS